MLFISKKYRDPLRLKETYKTNTPFPHIVLDNFISKELLDSVEKEFPDLKSLDRKNEYDSQLEIKLSSKGSFDLSPSASKLINFLNSDIFLKYLQELTGIKETLISDPYLSGGGYHEIKRGGVLKVHADFNKHPKLDLDRRLNLLLYLNKNWESNWGGNLELYESCDFSSPVVSIAPKFNTCVIFSTTSFTYHGHPQKLECPKEKSRKSIALYYFSTGRPSNEVIDKHSTLFVETKGEKFKSRLDFKNLIKDWLPPIILRNLKKVLKKE